MKRVQQKIILPGMVRYERVLQAKDYVVLKTVKKNEVLPKKLKTTFEIFGYKEVEERG